MAVAGKRRNSVGSVGSMQSLIDNGSQLSRDAQLAKLTRTLFVQPDNSDVFEVRR
jgi:hypothetical protein